MTVVHNLAVLAIYASSAMTMVLNISLVVYQRRRIRSIGRDMDSIKVDLADIEKRVATPEEKRRLKVAA